MAGAGQWIALFMGKNQCDLFAASGDSDEAYRITHDDKQSKTAATFSIPLMVS